LFAELPVPQRGVVDEFFAEACSAAGEWSDCAAVVAFFVEHEVRPDS
jgi:hypothetical protein